MDHDVAAWKISGMRKPGVTVLVKLGEIKKGAFTEGL